MVNEQQNSNMYPKFLKTFRFSKMFCLIYFACYHHIGMLNVFKIKKHLKHLTNTFRKGEFTTRCFFVPCKHALANLHTHIHV